jgi:hypothetical protein
MADTPGTSSGIKSKLTTFFNNPFTRFQTAQNETVITSSHQNCQTTTEELPQTSQSKIHSTGIKTPRSQKLAKLPKKQLYNSQSILLNIRKLKYLTKS